MRAKKLLWSCAVLGGALAALLFAEVPKNAPAEKSVEAAQVTDRGFSFAAYGDSRPMMYLPYKEGQPGLNKMFVELFGLVMLKKLLKQW